MKRQWYASPYALWMLMFTIVPLLFVVYYAFTGSDGSFTLANFQRITQPGYLPVLLTSLKLAFYCTLVCLLVGYPTAYFLASRDFSQNKMLVVLILLPMWMNFLLRTYAMMTILENNGLLNTLLEKLGLGKVKLIGTEGAVLLGMVYNFLPFMVLPIYTSMMKMDHRLIEAAQDLGAGAFTVFRRVVLPLTVPGIISGITMVFMPAVTTFVIPQMLNNKVMTVGSLIEYKFKQEVSATAVSGVGAALSMILMVLVIISMTLVNKFDKEGQGGGFL